MSDDMLTALLAAIDRRATEDTTSLDDARRARSARTPDMNNPMAPIYQRPARRTVRPYADPTGETAIGNRKRKR